MAIRNALLGGVDYTEEGLKPSDQNDTNNAIIEYSGDVNLNSRVRDSIITYTTGILISGFNTNNTIDNYATGIEYRDNALVMTTSDTNNTTIYEQGQHTTAPPLPETLFNRESGSVLFQTQDDYVGEDQWSGYEFTTSEYIDKIFLWWEQDDGDSTIYLEKKVGSTWSSLRSISDNLEVVTLNVASSIDGIRFRVDQTSGSSNSNASVSNCILMKDSSKFLTGDGTVTLGNGIAVDITSGLNGITYFDSSGTATINGESLYIDTFDTTALSSVTFTSVGDNILTGWGTLLI